MKTTKIAPGYYKGIYKGQDVTITKADLGTAEIAWYCQINDDQSVNDYVSTKALAIEAAKDLVDNATLYGIKLK